MGDDVPLLRSAKWGDWWINSLQYNPHGECYAHTPNKCQERVDDFLNNLLLKKSVHYHHELDFVNVIYTNGKYYPPAGWGRIHTACPEAPKVNRFGAHDDTMLLYNKAKWTPIGSADQGCLTPSHDARPFVAQAFRNNHNGWHIVVLGVHFPHPGQYVNKWYGEERLRDAVASVLKRGGTDKVVLMADTNADEKTSTKKVLQGLNVPYWWKDTVSTRFENTCCLRASSGTYTLKGYDRIAANFGYQESWIGHNAVMSTEVALTEGDVWNFGSRNMHLPVIGSLKVPQR